MMIQGFSIGNLAPWVGDDTFIRGQVTGGPGQIGIWQADPQSTPGSPLVSQKVVNHSSASFPLTPKLKFS